MNKKSEITENKQNRVPDEKGRMVFPKGVSGNPAGRPKGSVSLVTEMKRKLAEVHPTMKKSYAEALVDSILDDALMLDGPSRKLVMQYIEGMPQQKTELTHIIPKPLDDVRQNESIQENKVIDQENKSSTGGDSSIKDDKHSAVFDSEVSM